MKKFLNLQLGNLSRALFSIRFLACCFLVCIIVIFTSIPLIHPDQGAIELLEVGLGGSSGTVMLILALVPLIPFTLSFAMEYQQKAILPWVIRSGVKSYAIGKLFLSLVSAFFTTAIGLALVVFILSIWLPVHRSGIENAYRLYLVNDQVIRYLIFYIAHISLSSVLFAMIAFWVSTMIPNRYVTLSAPVVCYYMLHRLTSSLNIPVQYQAMYIFESVYDAGTAWSSFLLKLMTVLIISLPLAYLSYINIKRRVAYG